MTNDEKIWDQQLQYNIKREAPKISALSSGKIDKFEYRADEKILPFNQSQMIEQAKFTYSLPGKAFEKQTKTNEAQEEKQAKSLDSLNFSNKINELKQLENIFPGDQWNNLVVDRLKDIIYIKLN